MRDQRAAAEWGIDGGGAKDWRAANFLASLAGEGGSGGGSRGDLRRLPRRPAAKGATGGSGGVSPTKGAAAPSRGEGRDGRLPRDGSRGYLRQRARRAAPAAKEAAAPSRGEGRDGRLPAANSCGRLLEQRRGGELRGRRRWGREVVRACVVGSGFCLRRGRGGCGSVRTRGAEWTWAGELRHR